MENPIPEPVPAPHPAAPFSVLYHQKTSPWYSAGLGLPFNITLPNTLAVPMHFLPEFMPLHGPLFS